ncbi:unnamed protein product [Polarella glacialis]|uniref:Uncharacterized protein n=2 Tax=Polarella glacialis TaxID=89957 RepID=A0A813KK13_POLGL|nr:unnamed protein product [Polarella glacialis]
MSTNPMTQEAGHVVAPRKDLTLALSGCFLLCYMCYLLVQCRPSNLRRIWVSMIKHFQQICSRGSGEDRHKQQIHRQRIRWSNRFAEVLIHLFAVKHVVGFVVTLTVLDSALLDFVMSIMTRDYMPIVVLFAILASPTRFIVKILDASQILVTAWVIYNSVTFPSNLRKAGDFRLHRLISGLMTSNAWISCPCQLAICICSCVLSIGNNQVWFEEVWMEAWSSSMIIAVLIVSEMVIRRWVMDTVPAISEANERRLLSALCDAVVTLGPNLHILERAPKLANLLGQLQDFKDAGRSPSLEGSNFLDFMVDTDKSRFLRFVDRSALDWQAEPCSEPALAEALNLQLTSGGRGVSHQVQLFHSRFLDPDGKVSHLIGIIVEAWDQPASSDAASLTSRGPPIRRVQSDYSAAMLHSGDYSSTPTLEQEPDVSSAPSGLTDSISVVVARLERNDGQGRDEEDEQQDVFSEEQDSITPLRSQAPDVTVAFQQLKFIVKDTRKGAPPVINASLLHNEELLKWATQWTSTRNWMQDFVNAAVRPLNPTNWPSGAGEPSSLSFQVAISGTCSLPHDLITRATEPSFGPDQVARRLEIGRLKLQPVRHHAVRSSSKASSRPEQRLSPMGSSRHQGAKSKDSTSRPQGRAQWHAAYRQARQLAAEGGQESELFSVGV